MTDKLENDIRRGQRATELLDNELFDEAWTRLHEVYISAWSTSTPTQTVEREKLYLAIGILNAVRRNFEQIINTGKVADHELLASAEERKAEQLMASLNRGF